MKKINSSLLNMTLSLGSIALVSSLCLSLVYSATLEPIQQAKNQKLEKALKTVLPDFDRSESQTIDTEENTLTIFKAFLGSEHVGTAVNTFTKNGFGGEIRLMAGFLPDGSIHKISVLQHAETPGLGDKMDQSKSNFPIQFQGKNPNSFKLKVKKDGGDVDAITAATISSRAYCDALQRASDHLKASNPQ